MACEAHPDAPHEVTQGEPLAEAGYPYEAASHAAWRQANGRGAARPAARLAGVVYTKS